MFKKMNLIVGYGENKLQVVKDALGEDCDKYHILYKPENNWSPENYLKKLENYIIDNKIRDNFILITDNASLAVIFDLIICEMDINRHTSYVLIKEDNTLSEYDDRNYLFDFFLKYLSPYKDFYDYTDYYMDDFREFRKKYTKMIEFSS